jgi:hypothetical protein
MKPTFNPGAMGINPAKVKGPCAAGIDVKYTKLSLSICQPVRPDPERCIPQLVFYGELPDAENCLEVMKAYRCIGAVGDARPDPTPMVRLAAAAQKLHIDFHRTQYNTAPSNIEMTVNSKERLLTLERTMTLDNVFFAFSTGMEIAIPQNFRDICQGRFVKELTASVRVPIVWHGEAGYRWSEGGACDDAFHVLNFLMVAFKLAKLHLPRGDILMAQRGIVDSLMGGENDNPDDDVDVQLWDSEGSMSAGGSVVLQD